MRFKNNVNYFKYILDYKKNAGNRYKSYFMCVEIAKFY